MPASRSSSPGRRRRVLRRTLAKFVSFHIATGTVSDKYVNWHLREGSMPIDRDTTTAADQDDDDADGCLCGMDHLDENATLDEELPDASGGVETDDEVQPDEDEDDVDGCELDFTAEDQTSDEELPIAVGGT
jgi:hypothetical protein